MTTSGSYDYDLTASNLVVEILELIGALGTGETVSADDQATVMRTLNLFIKWLSSKGVGIWKNVEGTLFLEYEGYSYDIGSTGDHCSTTAYKTEIATASSSGDSTITVDSDDNITNGDYIGVELDDGTLQWTTVNGVPAANVVTLTDVLTDDVSVDSHVYNYTTKIQRPIELIEARIVNSEGYERPLIIKSRDEYMRLPNKGSTGSANLIYLESLTGNAKFHVWPACSDVKEYIKFSARILIEDIDSSTNTTDFPQEWLLPLAWNGGVLVAPKFGKVVDADFKNKANELLESVTGFDMENTSVFFKLRAR